MKKVNRVYILGTGNQAPYGIGEIIDVVPLAHWRKIQRICEEYYNPPTLRLNSKTGLDMEWDYDGDNVVGLSCI